MMDEGKPRQVRGTAVREKILETADALFYCDGVRAIGVDTIVEESKVAKTSLYRWFPTKDDLIAAFLERRNALFWAQWDKVAAKHAGKPRAELDAHLAWIGRYATSREFRGCPFLNTTAAFPEAGHPARAVCERNKGEMHARLLALATGANARDSQLLADQLLLLIDGAFANAPVLGKASPARALATAGGALVDASVQKAA